MTDHSFNGRPPAPLDFTEGTQFSDQGAYRRGMRGNPQGLFKPDGLVIIGATEWEASEMRPKPDPTCQREASVVKLRRCGGCRQWLTVRGALDGQCTECGFPVPRG